MHLDFSLVEHEFFPFDHAFIGRVEILVADVDELGHGF